MAPGYWVWLLNGHVTDAINTSHINGSTKPGSANTLTRNSIAAAMSYSARDEVYQGSAQGYGFLIRLDSEFRQIDPHILAQANGHADPYRHAAIPLRTTMTV